MKQLKQDGFEKFENIISNNHTFKLTHRLVSTFLNISLTFCSRMRGDGMLKSHFTRSRKIYMTGNAMLGGKLSLLSNT